MMHLIDQKWIDTAKEYHNNFNDHEYLIGIKKTLGRLIDNESGLAKTFGIFAPIIAKFKGYDHYYEGKTDILNLLSIG